MNKTKNKIKEIIKDATETDKKILLNDDIFVHHQADSLDQVEIVMALEEEFNIEISDEQMDTTRTLRGYMNVVEEQQKQKNAA